MMNRDLARFGNRPKVPDAAPQAQASTKAAGAKQPGARPGPHPSANKSEDMAQIIRQLCDLLTKENLALKRHRQDEVQAMTERKEQLARLYQGHMNALHRDPTILKSLEESKKVALVHSATRLSELMKENASLLKANILTINTFMKSVVNAVKSRQEEKSAAYSRGGFMNNYGTSRRQLAVTYNQTM